MPYTLERIQKAMHYFPYELQMYCYHKLNQRPEVAQTYLDTYNDMQEAIGRELTKTNTSYIEQLDDDTNGQETKEGCENNN